MQFEFQNVLPLESNSMTGPQLTAPPNVRHLRNDQRYMINRIWYTVYHIPYIHTKYFKTETGKRLQTITDINEHGVTVTNEECR